MYDSPCALEEDTDEVDPDLLVHHEALPEVCGRLEAFVEEAVLLLDFAVVQLLTAAVHGTPRERRNTQYPQQQTKEPARSCPEGVGPVPTLLIHVLYETQFVINGRATKGMRVMSLLEDSDDRVSEGGVHDEEHYDNGGKPFRAHTLVGRPPTCLTDDPHNQGEESNERRTQQCDEQLEVKSSK